MKMKKGIKGRTPQLLAVKPLQKAVLGHCCDSKARTAKKRRFQPVTGGNRKLKKTLNFCKILKKKA